MPAKAGTQGLPALNASLDSRLRGSDERAVGVACIFANLRNEVLALEKWLAGGTLTQSAELPGASSARAPEGLFTTAA
jgi:hypothetical protein